MSYSLSNICAKNYQNRLMCIKVIVCNISVVFRHSVLLKYFQTSVEKVFKYQNFHTHLIYY